MPDNGEGCIYRSGHEARITLMITMLGLILTIQVAQAVWAGNEIKEITTRLAVIEYRENAVKPSLAVKKNEPE